MVGGHGEGYFYPTWMTMRSPGWTSSIGAFPVLINCIVPFCFACLNFCGCEHPSYADAECNA
jgi:hypothetical protein